MKFLIFSPYYPPHKGGLESHSAEFNHELVKLGHEVTVFTPNLPVMTDTDTLNHGTRIIRYPAFELVPNFPVPKFWQSLFYQQLGILNHYKPDFVITRTRFFLLSFIGLVFAKYHRVHHVHIEHGSDFVQLTSSLSTALARVYDFALGALVFKFSSLNISISEAVHRFVMRFDQRDSPIIRRGLDFTSIDAVAPALPESLSPYQDRILLVTVARLYKWKGIEQSIEAIRSLPKTLQDKICFVIVGGGEDFDRLKKLSIGLPIVLLGQQENEVALAIRKKADIFLHSSQPGGGLSTSLLEAMYTECAVIATPHEGASEVVTDEKNGLLIHNHTEFVEALTLLIEDEEVRERYAKASKQTIIDNFSWEKSIQKYLHVFETLTQI
jgi:glycosyltransferase involved in cell wall biosynthesis